MRYIGKYKNLKLRQRQVEILSDAMGKLKNTGEVEWFLKSLLTPSELAYISQRIDIMQAILKEQSYLEIRDQVGTTNGTINATKQQLKHADKKFWRLILSSKPKPTKRDDESVSNGYPWAEAHLPGAIRFK